MSYFATYNLGTNRVTNVYGGSYNVIGSIASSVVYLGIPASNVGLYQVSGRTPIIPYDTVFNLKLTVSGGNAVVDAY